MILAHVMGMPVEETVLQLAPAGAATVALVAMAGRTQLTRLLARTRRRSWKH
jgi:uncharacterized membrane protein AbrB (regulator of aidB expression)